MRIISCVSVTLTALLVPRADAFMLPLTLLNRQAYAANVSINGQSTLLQVGTMTSDVWLACSRFGSRVCTPGTCDAYLSIETQNLCVTKLPGVSLTLQSSSEVLAFPDVPLRVAQYHVVDGNASAPKVYTSNGQVYSTPDYSSEQPPLVDSNVQGVLGLGRNSEEILNLYNKPSPFKNSSVLDQVKNFALYLSKENDGIGSYVKLGNGSSVRFDPISLSERGLTTSYKLPLRGVGRRDSSAFQSWDLSLVGVQFGGDTALYPRNYDAVETPGGDAKAILSLNHPLIVMPDEVRRLIRKTYLSTCSYGRTEPVGTYYTCDLSILDTLPRISLYLNDKVFFLDPVDYTHISSTNKSARIVEIWSSDRDRAWILGTPFLRKFPVIFSGPQKSVDVYCTAGSSCRTQIGPFERVYIESLDGGVMIGGSSGSSAGGSPVTMRPSVTSSPSYSGRSRTPQLLPWITWIMMITGTALVLTFVVGLVRTWMHKLEARRRGMTNPPTGDACTVASERDFEETKRELQQLIAEEEAEARAVSTRRQNGSFVALQSPVESVASGSPRTV